MSTVEGSKSPVEESTSRKRGDEAWAAVLVAVAVTAFAQLIGLVVALGGAVIAHRQGNRPARTVLLVVAAVAAVIVAVRWPASIGR